MGASLLAATSALTAVAANSGTSLSAFAEAAFRVPERSELEPLELKAAIDSCLKSPERKFARVMSAGPGEPGHAEIRLESSDRSWECIARLDGTGLFSLRRLDTVEVSPSLATEPTAVSTPAVSDLRRSSSRVGLGGADGDATSANGQPRSAKPSSAVRVIQRDNRAALGRSGSNSGLRLEFTPYESASASIKLTGGADHQLRPVQGGSQEFLRPSAWHQIQQMDLGLDMSFAEGRLRYRGRRSSISESSTSEEGLGRLYEARLGADERGALRESHAYPSVRNSLATSSTGSDRFDADLIRQAGIRLSAWGSHDDFSQEGSFADSVRPLQLLSRSPTLEGVRRRAREVGASLNIKPLKLSLSQRGERQAHRESERLRAKAVYGPVALSVSQRTSERLSRVSGRRTLRESTDGRLDVSLESHRLNSEGEGGLRRMIPSGAWVSSGASQTRYPWLDADDQVSTYGAGLSWSWENGDTEVGFSRGQEVSRGLSLEPSDMEDWSLDFSQTSHGRVWDGTAYAYASSSRTDPWGAGSSEMFFGGGLTATLQAERLPITSISVAIDRFDAFYEGFLGQSRDQSLDLRLDLDFSKYLPERNGPASYLRAGFQTQRALSRSSQSLRSEDWGHRAYLTYGAPF